MVVASDITSIMHEIDATSVKVELTRIMFIKFLYLTFSNYFESLQASAQIQDLKFDTLVEKIAKKEKSFGKKITQPIGETVCLSLKGNNQSQDSSRGDGNKRGLVINNFRGRGVKHNHGDRPNIQYVCSGKKENETKTCKIPCENITEIAQRRNM